MADAQVNVRASGDVAARVGRALGIALPIEPNTVATVGECSILWLGPDEWLVVDSKSSAAEIEAHVRAAFAPDWGSTVDVSANRTIVELAGPLALRARPLRADTPGQNGRDPVADRRRTHLQDPGAHLLRRTPRALARRRIGRVAAALTVVRPAVILWPATW